MTETQLTGPYGGQLVDLVPPCDEIDDLKARAAELPSLQISERSVCDLELLATGGFSPLERFMGQADYERVVEEMRLADDTLFPIPIVLPVGDEDPVELGGKVALRDSRNNLLAMMQLDELYEWDRKAANELVFGTSDSRHPLVAEMHRWGRRFASGPLEIVQLPARYDYKRLRLTPAETRERLADIGHRNVVAFQTRNPLHRVHEELTKRAIASVDGTLLLHPVVGMTKPGDVDHYTRVRTYRALADNYYDDDRVLLALLPLAMRLAGPREALWHAIIRRNYGANHLIVGRDHASPGVDSRGEPFYDPYAAQELVREHEAETGVKAVTFGALVYLPDEDRYEDATKVAPGVRTAAISGTQVRDEYLRNGRLLPEWFTRREVAAILADAYPARHKQGVCIWFTGLSGAGKSTVAEVLTVLLQECGRQVTVLDGDVVRTHLSKGLGFSKDDRDINIRRIGFVASELVRHGATAICAAVSPYRATRNDVRNMVGADRFVEVFVDTPLAVCEERDTKGLYSKARRGEIRGFTGIDDPYEEPDSAEIILDTVQTTPEDNAHQIVAYLRAQGFIVEAPMEADDAREPLSAVQGG